MATFTQDEIDFIKEHGNEYCRRIWLGLMNLNSPQNFDTKDEQKMKDLMSAKYELKRYYLDPSIANQNTVSQPRPQSTSNVPRVPNSSTSTTLPAPVVQKSTANTDVMNNSNNFSTDFVADFSKVPDPFCPVTIAPANQFGQQPIAPQPFFANFDNNPIFNNSKGMETSAMFNQVGGNGTMNMNGIHAPPSEDRYAALKDLDSLMKQTQLKEEAPGTLSASTWNANNSNALNATWSIGVNNQTHVISNPFTGGDLWRPSANVVNNNTQPVDSSLCNPANPFKPIQFPVNNDSQWIGAPNNGDVLQLSQLMTPLANKVWQPSVPAYHPNPFMVGTGVSNMTRNSNNPFL